MRVPAGQLNAAIPIRKARAHIGPRRTCSSLSPVSPDARINLAPNRALARRRFLRFDDTLPVLHGESSTLLGGRARAPLRD